MSQATGKDLAAFFNQYLRTTMIPLLEYRIEGNTLHYRYADIVRDFDMPVRVTINGKPVWLFPNAEWKADEFGEPLTGIDVDPNFYIESNNIGQP
jgi:aminopeptidase N